MLRRLAKKMMRAHVHRSEHVSRKKLSQSNGYDEYFC